MQHWNCQHLKIPKTRTLSESVDYNDYTVVQLKEMLDQQGITYSSKANKSTLIELLGG